MQLSCNSVSTVSVVTNLTAACCIYYSSSTACTVKPGFLDSLFRSHTQGAVCLKMLHLMESVLLAFLLSIVSVKALNSFSRPGSKVSGDNDWDYLLFVQRWPASACVDGHITGEVRDEVQGEVQCSFPSNISSTVRHCSSCRG